MQLPKENLYKLKEYLEKIIGKDVRFRIIFFVRHPISWGASAVQQRVKRWNAAGYSE